MNEMPSCYNLETPTARKAHTCCECSGEILAGEKYFKHSGVWDGSGATYKVCADCEALKEEVDKDIKYADERTAFGQLYETVFEGHGDNAHILRFMDIRRKRRVPESPKGWMEKREQEILSREVMAT